MGQGEAKLEAREPVPAGRPGGPQVAGWVHAAARGDSEAWLALVDCFSGLVWSVTRAFRLSREDAADVSQTTWLRAAEHIHRLRKPESFGGWLATTVRRECLVMLRQHHRQVAVPDLEPESPDRGDGCLPDAALLVREEQDALWRAFCSLPPVSQLLLRLLFADPPLSYQEIGAATGMPVGSIGPSRGRCLARLRAEMELPVQRLGGRPQRQVRESGHLLPADGGQAILGRRTALASVFQ
jgi:RNA polymerase sigma factor (sigma-70 family)